jgi:uncharacterized membrane protein (UPF0127 family)
VIATLLLWLAVGGATPAPWASAVFPDGATFGLEIAADVDTRARGYMGRAHVGRREGMLFVFEQAGIQPFWMKNCLTRLDVIWMDDRFRVLDIAHDLAPCPPQGDCPNVAPMAPARYVLEVAGGTARAHGLRRGDVVVVLGLEGRAAP